MTLTIDLPDALASRLNALLPELTRQRPGLAQALADLCQNYHVRELSLFGSAVRGELRPDSDLDILVAFEPEAHIGFMMLSRMARELSQLLGRPVDLVPKDGLKPAIRTAVLAEAEALFAA